MTRLVKVVLGFHTRKAKTDLNYKCSDVCPSVCHQAESYVKGKQYFLYRFCMNKIKIKFKQQFFSWKNIFLTIVVNNSILTLPYYLLTLHHFLNIFCSQILIAKFNLFIYKVNVWFYSIFNKNQPIAKISRNIWKYKFI